MLWVLHVTPKQTDKAIQLEQARRYGEAIMDHHSMRDKLQEARQNTRADKRRDFLAGKQAAENLSKALNGGSRETIMLGFLEGLAYEHRYLQSETILVLLQTLSHLGSEEFRHHVDGRNEHAIKACQEVCKLLADRTGIE